MKQSVKIALIVLALAVVLAVAALVYPFLVERYQAQQAPSEDQTQADGETDEAIQAVDFTVFDQDGNQVALSDFFGKPIVLNFWATWCGPCKSELPAFDRLHSEYGEDVVFLMINLADGRDTLEGVQDFMEEEGYTFPVYFDTEANAAYAYQIRSIPMTIFINEDSEIADWHLGALDGDTLQKKLDNLLGGGQ
jgi:thiol-disulfide isomerase/thioredoxin